MAKQNLTIFQKLGQIVAPDGIKPKQQQPAQTQPQRYNIGKDVLLKTDDKKAYELAKLQAQQGKYLGQVWKKVEHGLFQQAVNYETTRIGSYSDFEAMEFYPEIAAALDIMMEESTTLNNDGRMVNVYSDSKRVKGIIEDLIFNRLDIHTSLPMWTRNTVKYGDNFVYLNISETNGIMGSRQMPNYEMERRDGGLFDMLTQKTDEDYKTDKTKYYWRGRDVEFNSWQIAHFRLLGDDRRLPYGTSVLEKARRIWKQLLLSEDAMLVYRVTRAPERRIYKIYVGNIDDKDVEAYVNEIANRFKRQPMVDPQTGQIDLRYNQLSNDQDYFIPVRSEDAPNPIDTLPGACLSLDTRIPLLDGRILELQEIIYEWDNGNKDMWVYSVDPNTGASTVGPITWAGVTRKNTQVLKITLDNGKTITSTPDHKFVHRTNGFVEAQNLVVGDSLMPFYTDTAKIRSNTNDYQRIWDTATQKWIFTHRLVKNNLIDSGLIKNFEFDEKYINADKKIIHHKDHNRFNNSPNNLVMMNGSDHIRYHQAVIKETIWGNPELNKTKIALGVNKFISNLSNEEKTTRAKQSKNNSVTTRGKSNETFNKNPNKQIIITKRGKAIADVKSTTKFKDKFSKIASNNWLSEGYKEKVFSKRQPLNFSDTLYNMFFDMFKQHGKADLTLNELNKSVEFMTEFVSTNNGIRSSLTNLDVFTHNHLEKMLKQRGFKNYRDWSKSTAEDLGYKNLRAFRYSIKKNQKELLYNHKIILIEWLTDFQDTGTITVDGDEKYQSTHTFACESGVYVKNSNLDQIADIEYLQKKLFTALRVPKPFLGFDETTGDGKNLAMQDIRFSRTVNRIQQAMLQELNKIVIIHLYLLGFEDDLDNFTLTLNNPSTQAEMLKIEHLQLKMTLFKDAVSDAGNGFAAMSMTRAKREILGWADNDIKQDLLEQRMEKAAAAELANSANVIKHTGMFDVVDRIYGDMKLALKGGGTPPEGAEGGSAGGSGGSIGGGGFGGGGVSPEDLDFGSEDGEETENGTDGEAPEAAGSEGATGDATEASSAETTAEAIKKVEKLLVEEKAALTAKLNARAGKYQNRFFNKLIDMVNHEEKPLDNVKIIDKTVKINETVNNMIRDIDGMLKD